MLETSDTRLQIAILGRPNVGKSSLFNIFTGSRKAIVKDEPGVTRDIHYERVDVWGREFDLIDTGGMTDNDLPFADEVRDQVERLLPMMDMALVVMDARDGILSDDREVLTQVQKSKKPFVVLVNKIDSEKDQDILMSEFYQLGVDIIPTSFERRRGIDVVSEWIVERVPKREDLDAEKTPRIAIIGKPNAGKSSLVNYLLGADRMVVSSIPGTTVDAIDSPIKWNGKTYTFVDTAGLRRKARRDTGVEILSAFKSEKAVKDANIVVLLLDGLINPSLQDARLVELALEMNKAIVVAVNKSDVGRKQIDDYRNALKEKVGEELYFSPDIPVVFVSAKTGQGIDQLFEVLDQLWERLHMRISTSQVNDFLVDLTRKTPPPIFGNRNVKFLYFTQTKQVPPSFVCFVNNPRGISESYRRFMVNEARKHWGLLGVPIRFYMIRNHR
ncbi:MAG: ribosome biogenesis GTPase Der [Pseudomonadota bacterium]|nr:ribosome biogenesis GTPase Der [Pseudomonadota bacterium]